MTANPFVDYLNSLRTQDGASNPNYVEENRSDYLAGIRAQHPWFPTEEGLRVETRISALVSAMIDPDFPADLVILTGDAGDGKTAACFDLVRRLEIGPPRTLRPLDRAGPWTILKDASEATEEELRSGLEAPHSGGKLLMAINEGRLRRLRHHPALEPLWETVIDPALSTWIDASVAADLDAQMRAYRIAVVNFRHRMHVRTVAPALYRSWTVPTYWESGPCGACPARDRCAILRNVTSLREDAPVARISDVLSMAHFSGHRLPFRRLQAVLAYTVTGGLACRAVLDGRPQQLADRYFSLLFQREPREDLRPEPIARVLAPADAGQTVDPVVEAEIATWMRSPDAAPVSPFEVAALAGSTAVDATRALRRYAALEKDTPTGPWRRALGLLEDYARGGDGEALRAVVVRGLNRLHRADAATGESITNQQMEPSAFRDPSRASLELALGTRFTTDLARGPVLPALVEGWLESCPADIDLIAWPAEAPRPPKPARLRLDARIVAMLIDADTGFAFVPALGTYRAELARFHAHLLSLLEPQSIAVTLRRGSRAWTISAHDNRLRLSLRD